MINEFFNFTYMTLLINQGSIGQQYAPFLCSTEALEGKAKVSPLSGISLKKQSKMKSGSITKILIRAALINVKTYILGCFSSNFCGPY
jgi:hypothetical protein